MNRAFASVASVGPIAIDPVVASVAGSGDSTFARFRIAGVLRARIAVVRTVFVTGGRSSALSALRGVAVTVTRVAVTVTCVTVTVACIAVAITSIAVAITAAIAVPLATTHVAIAISVAAGAIGVIAATRSAENECG